MSLIAEYRQTELAIEELKQRLAAMDSDESLKKEKAFDEKLRALMGEYGKSLRDIIQLLDPERLKSDKKAGTTKGKRSRKVQVFKNAETGEVIRTKGGNHLGLKEWKAKYGADVVASWRQPDEE